MVSYLVMSTTRYDTESHQLTVIEFCTCFDTLEIFQLATKWLSSNDFSLHGVSYYSDEFGDHLSLYGNLEYVKL